ncbi:MAG: hypothetical protein ABSG45_05455 [Nitrososphaerales archaeon]|jgi:hypothetical protein
MTAASEPDDSYVAGFILNKLYYQRCFARRKGAKHGKHIQLSSLQSGLPPGTGNAIKLAEKMDGVTIKIFKSTNDDHVCALIDEDAIALGLPTCNYFRERTGQKPFGKDFKEMVEAQQGEAKKDEFRKLTEKEKRNKAWREKTEQWWGDKDLSNQAS